MPRLRQHGCLQAYALDDLAKYANPGKVMSQTISRTILSVLTKIVQTLEIVQKA
jgi:hypothetical protein